MSSPHDPQPPIGYAPPPKWHQTKRFHRLLIFGAIAILLASSINWGPPLVRRMQTLYCQHRCLDSSASLETKDDAWNQMRVSKTSISALFIGPMHNELSQKKLVYIGDGGMDIKDIADIALNPRRKLELCVVEPGNLFREPIVLSIGAQWIDEASFDNYLPAQADPADSSHLVLKTELTGYTIDVWLRGDMLIVEPREPALSASATTQPSP